MVFSKTNRVGLLGKVEVSSAKSIKVSMIAS